VFSWVSSIWYLVAGIPLCPADIPLPKVGRPEGGSLKELNYIFVVYGSEFWIVLDTSRLWRDTPTKGGQAN